MLHKLWLGGVVAAVLLLVGWVIVAPPGLSSYGPSYGDGDCRPEKALLPMIVHQELPYFDGPGEVEPNNSSANANGPIRSGVTYQGQGAPLDQNDYYRFYLAAAGEMMIDVNNDTTQNVQQVQLYYQSTGNPYVDIASGDPPYHIDYSGQAGWYYVRIYTAPHFNLTVNYTLQASYPVPPTPTAQPPMATPTCAMATPTSTVTKTPTSTPTPTSTLPPGWYEVGTNSATGGGISNNSSTSLVPSLATAPDGFIYAAWYNDTEAGDSEIFVRRWNGANWEEVGTGSASGNGISNNNGNSWQPSTAIDLNNMPYIAWMDDSNGDTEIYVRRWNGSSWQEVGTGSASGEGISINSGTSTDPDMAIAPNGTPYITWGDNSGGDFEVYVRRWNGSIWEEIGSGSASGGGISNNSGTSNTPVVAFAPNNTPYIAWADDSDGDSEIYVRRWNGTIWEEVGGGSAGGGGISNNSAASFAPVIAVTSGGIPYIAWTDETDGEREIYVRRWNGSIWEEVGAGSAGGGGISNNSAHSIDPSITSTSASIVYIAWHDEGGNGDRDIYVRRWNGSNWEEVGAGSANGDGISNNSGNSINASAAIASNSVPYIVWADNSNGNHEIYVRRWLGP